MLKAQNKDEIENLKKQIKKLEQKVESLEKKNEVKGSKKTEKTSKKSEEEPYFDFYWKRRLHIKSKDDKVDMSIGGRIQLDVGFVHEDKSIRRNIEVMDDYVEFRSVRLDIRGTLYKYFIYRMFLDFSDDLSMKDVYVGVTKLPLNGNLYIGHMREPIGLEAVTPAACTVLMERSSNIAFTPGRNLGVRFLGYEPDLKIHIGLGVFHDTEADDPPEITDAGGYAFTGRVCITPWYENKGEKLLHLGIGYSFRNPRHSSIRYRSRPENHVDPRLIDTGTIEGVEDVHLLGIEGSLNIGPFFLQSELIYSFQRYEGGYDGATPDKFWGYYVFAGYFITGEHRNYKAKHATFSRLKPKKSVFDGGIGAISLAARYSKINLNEEIRGRRMDNFTFGVNWYPEETVRFSINYIYSKISHIEHENDNEDLHLFMMRFQLEF